MTFGDVRVIPVNGTGPEDVLLDSQLRVYTGLEDGRIIRVSADGATIDTLADTGGRPLGIEFHGDDELLVCDATRGLLVLPLTGGTPRTLVREFAGAPLLVCNNAAVATDGSVYFTDSSTRFPLSRWREDLIEGTGTGRLLRRSPDGELEVLMGGLHFANGVALAPDESFVLVAETGTRGLRRLHLTGSSAGRQEEFLTALPGFPDNISTGSDGLFWITQASPNVAALDVVRRMPAAVRTLARNLPTALQPAPGRAVGVLGVDSDGGVVREMRGEIPGFQMLTGVRERDGRLCFGSLRERAIAITGR